MYGIHRVLNMSVFCDTRKAIKMAKRKYISRTMKPQEFNPWHHQLATTIKTKNKIVSVGQSQSVIDHETGEINGLDAVQMTRKLVDREEFVKMFSGGISAMFDLRKSAQELFRAILDIYLLQTFEGERVFLHEEELAKVGYTRTKVTRTQAINQLIAANFIAPIKNMPNFYWTNPTMFYKGDRLTVVKQYAIKGTKSGDRMKRQIEKEAALANQATLPLNETEQ